jgi:hypothetical protein
MQHRNENGVSKIASFGVWKAMLMRCPNRFTVAQIDAIGTL